MKMTHSGTADLNGSIAAASGKIPITLTINGAGVKLAVAPWTTLLDALRDHLNFTGTKKGCDHGQCGACTVLVEGRRINSCLTLAVMREGTVITTIEGLSKPCGALHPMQQAFIDHDAFQCGYCTPGQIISAVSLLNECTPTDDEIREGMSGNICRCGAYVNIVAAIQDVRDAQVDDGTPKPGRS